MRQSFLSVIAALIAITTVASADELSDLKAQNAELRKQNTALSERVRVLEKKLLSSAEKQNDLADEKKKLEALAGLTASGDNVKSAEARVVSAYDEKQNATRVTIQAHPIDIVKRGVLQTQFTLAFEYTYAGREMKKKPQFVTMILNTIDNNSNTAQKYRNARSIGITTKGDESKVAITGYKVVNTRRRVGKKRYDESIRVDLDQATQERLAKSISAQLRLSSTNLAFTRDHAAMIAAMIKRIDLGK